MPEENEPHFEPKNAMSEPETATSNPPPKVILTGNVQQFDTSKQEVSSLAGAKQSDLNYVVGPDGQMYAFSKPPFSWKQFGIGIGVPTLLMLAAIFGVALSESDNYSYERQNFEIFIEPVNNTTEFIYKANEQEIRVENTESVSSCWGFFQKKEGDEIIRKNFNCGDVDYLDLDIEIYSWNQTSDREEKVGDFNRKTATFLLDYGTDSDFDEVQLNFEVVDTDEFNDYLDNVENGDWAGLFWALACFASPIIGLLGSIIAFSTGRKDMGIGFLTALALLPIFLVGMLIVAW